MMIRLARGQQGADKGQRLTDLIFRQPGLSEGRSTASTAAGRPLRPNREATKGLLGVNAATPLRARLAA
jgi:hypothetical protein